MFLLYLELLIGQPRTLADWQHRWERRNDLPCVSEVRELPPQDFCERQRGLWWRRVEQLEAGKFLWENTPDAGRFEQAVRQARYHHKTWALAHHLRQGWYAGGAMGKWADSWEKRVMLAELYERTNKP